ncbi:MAG: hypothetical protein IPI66_04735 [Chitinophagaceae bacterium]|nr:hypothetical protein [Chitinophagaceae bacterium]
MIRQVVSAILFMVFLFQTFSGSLIVFDYITNTASYARNCINKARPKLHCNGKCQMMKKLQQEEKKDQQCPERKAETNELVFSSVSGFQLPELFYITLPGMVSFERSHPLTDRSFDFFHPPQA